MKTTAEVAADIRADKFWLSAPLRGGGAAVQALLDDLAIQVETAAPAEAEALLRRAAARFGEERQSLYGAMLRGWLLEWADQLRLPCGGKGHWATWRTRLHCGRRAA